MIKKLGIFVFIGFIAVQMLSFLHMADYDFEQHDHNNQLCALSLHEDYDEGNPSTRHFYDYVFKTANSEFLNPNVLVTKHIIAFNLKARAPPSLT
ncbi:MAG: hypothetical protein ACJAQ0_000207 [Dasania sp.]|jgi:hypothetical protein